MPEKEALGKWTSDEFEDLQLPDLYGPNVDNLQGKGYPPRWEGHGSRGAGPGTEGQTFPWANEHSSMERLMQGWVIATMMRDRGINPVKLAAYMGISRQAVNYMVVNLERGNNYERLERAITDYTDSVGGVYRAADMSELEAAEAEERLKQWLEA